MESGREGERALVPGSEIVGRREKRKKEPSRKGRDRRDIEVMANKERDIDTNRETESERARERESERARV